jgi:hypothetical protein
MPKSPAPTSYRVSGCDQRAAILLLLRRDARPGIGPIGTRGCGDCRSCVHSEGSPDALIQIRTLHAWSNHAVVDHCSREAACRRTCSIRCDHVRCRLAEVAWVPRPAARTGGGPVPWSNSSVPRASMTRSPTPSARAEVSASRMRDSLAASGIESGLISSAINLVSGAACFSSSRRFPTSPQRETRIRLDPRPAGPGWRPTPLRRDRRRFGRRSGCSSWRAGRPERRACRQR